MFDKLRATSTLLIVWLLLATPGGFAAEIAGVSLADQIEDTKGEPLVLNGAGVRSKFFFNIYVAALYLPEQTQDPTQAITMSGNKRVLMHFLYDGVSAEKIAKGWTEGFERNLDDTAFKLIRDRLNTFNSMFTEMRAGDRMQLDYVPDTGVTVSINGIEKGTIEGQDFMYALFSVWLGSDPADEDLKMGMLGKISSL